MAVDVSTSIIIHRPSYEVATFAAKPDNAPYWNGTVKAARWLTDRPLAVGSQVLFIGHFLGRRLEYVYEVAEFMPGERLVMHTERRPFPMETTYIWESLPERYTLMTLRTRGTPGPLPAAASPMLSLAIRRANTRDLARLKTILEQGVRTEAYEGQAAALRAC